MAEQEHTATLSRPVPLAPLSADHFDAFLPPTERDWLAVLLSFASRCDELEAGATADRQSGAATISLTPDAVIDFLRYANTIAEGVIALVRVHGVQELMRPIRRPTTGPGLLGLTPPPLPKAKGGRPKLASDEKKREWLVAFLKLKAEYEKAKGKPAKDIDVLRDQVSGLSDLSARDRKRLVEVLVRDVSKWRQQFNKPLRTKRRTKS